MKRPAGNRKMPPSRPFLFPGFPVFPLSRLPRQRTVNVRARARAAPSTARKWARQKEEIKQKTDKQRAEINALYMGRGAALRCFRSNSTGSAFYVHACRAVTRTNRGDGRPRPPGDSIPKITSLYVGSRYVPTYYIGRAACLMSLPSPTKILHIEPKRSKAEASEAPQGSLETVRLIAISILFRETGRIAITTEFYGRHGTRRYGAWNEIVLARFSGTIVAPILWPERVVRVSRCLDSTSVLQIGGCLARSSLESKQSASWIGASSYKVAARLVASRGRG